MLRLAFAVVFLISAIGSCAQIVQSAKPQIIAPLRPLLEALANAGVSGSLELSSRCAAGPPFPNLRSRSTSGGSVLQVVREMFADNPAMQVMQDADGMVRMIENGAQTDLPNVRISHVWFESKGVPLQYAAFSPTTALRQILQSPEVVTFMKAHGMDLAIRPQGAFVNEPFPDESPHITESMNEVTLSEALDRVLKTFPGIWFYENCPQSDGKRRLVFLMFFNLQHPGLVEEEPVKVVSH
jgi:hypothetical protein